jgi:chorismate synthase
MAGNTFGTVFRITNFGESHGIAIGCIIDGCPPGLPLTEQDIQPELNRRRPGTSRHVTQRNEADAVEILSGTYQGLTTGTPIALIIRNTDQRSKDYGDILDTFRPGHADYTYWQKYGIRDPRGGGRSSARLTAPMVAAGAIAKKWLATTHNIAVRGCMIALGEMIMPKPKTDLEWQYVNHNPFYAADSTQIPALEQYMDNLRRAQDSVGAKLYVEAVNVPVGWGAPLFDKLDADIAYALMGINAVKGVEIGDGFAVVSQRGSYHGDNMQPDGFESNHSGGVLGGISTGQTVCANLAIKPTSSIHSPKPSINRLGKPTVVQTSGRHDPCVGIRATPIAEAMLSLVLIDHALLALSQPGMAVNTPKLT